MKNKQKINEYNGLLKYISIVLRNKNIIQNATQALIIDTISETPFRLPSIKAIKNSGKNTLTKVQSSNTVPPFEQKNKILTPIKIVKKGKMIHNVFFNEYLRPVAINKQFIQMIIKNKASRRIINRL